MLTDVRFVALYELQIDVNVSNIGVGGIILTLPSTFQHSVIQWILLVPVLFLLQVSSLYTMNSVHFIAPVYIRFVHTKNTEYICTFFQAKGYIMYNILGGAVASADSADHVIWSAIVILRKMVWITCIVIPVALWAAFIKPCMKKLGVFDLLEKLGVFWLLDRLGVFRLAEKLGEYRLAEKLGVYWLMDCCGISGRKEVVSNEVERNKTDSTAPQNNDVRYVWVARVWASLVLSTVVSFLAGHSIRQVTFQGFLGLAKSDSSLRITQNNFCIIFTW